MLQLEIVNIETEYIKKYKPDKFANVNQSCITLSL